MPAKDFTTTIADNLDAPVSYAEAFTDAQKSFVTGITRAIYVGSSGDILVTMAKSTEPVLFENLAVGWHPIRAKEIDLTVAGAASSVVGTW